jgi:hypothetical protein
MDRDLVALLWITADPTDPRVLFMDGDGRLRLEEVRR